MILQLTMKDTNQPNENHHLWSNRGVWWIVLTFSDEKTSIRIRHSLRTKDVEKARARRDRVMRAIILSRLRDILFSKQFPQP